jgi:D-amino peptidase
MRVYISVDMEGIATIVDADQVRTNGSDFAKSRELMSDEANAAATAAFEAGATEVVVNDSHGDGRNLLPERFDRRVRLILGDFKPLSMMEGIDDGRFDACVFIGYHSRMGALASTLDHTFASALVADIFINDRVVNEAYINALIAGHNGTPIVLVSGDEAFCKETREMIGTEFETVIVKWSRTRNAAKSLHPAEARNRIHETTKLALGNLGKYRPFKIEGPLVLKVRMHNTGIADNAAVMPGAIRHDGFTVGYRAHDPIDMFRALQTFLGLGRAGIPQVRPK